MQVKPVYVAAAGVASPFGDDLESVWQALLSPPVWREHIVCAGERQRWVKAHIARADEYASDAAEYFVKLCRRALQGLITDAAGEIRGKSCLLLGSGMGASDRYLSDQPAPARWELAVLRRICDGLTGRMPAKWMANACCAGAQAIAYGCDLIRSHVCDTVIAGGAESFSYLTYAGFERLGAIDPDGCRPFDQRRKGIGVGEGAAFFLLTAERPSAPIGCLLGCGVTADAYHIVTPAPDGEAIRRAMALALQRSLLAPRQIDAVIAHGTGTKANDAAESAAIHGLLADTPVTAPKGSLGHTGGACGAFQLLAALGCLRHQTLPSIGGLTCLDERLPIQPALKSRAMPLKRLLVNCFGFGGSNVSMVCAAVHGERYLSIWNARRRTLQDVDPPKRPSPRMRQTVTLSGPNTIPQPKLSRWMDDLSVQALALADRLMERDHESWAGRYDVGIVLSVDEGARESLSRCAAVLRRGEARQLNPGQFPHVMLSTALSYLTQRLGVHGPACVFVEPNGEHAQRYARVQLALGHCHTMLCFYICGENDLQASVWEQDSIGSEADDEGSADKSKRHDIQPK